MGLDRCYFDIIYDYCVSVSLLVLCGFEIRCNVHSQLIALVKYISSLPVATAAAADSSRPTTVVEEQSGERYSNVHEITTASWQGSVC